MIWLLLLGSAAYAASVARTNTKLLKSLKLDDGRLSEANDRSRLVYDQTARHQQNLDAGNWAYSTPIARPPKTMKYFRAPTPIGSDWVEWGAEGNQWLRTPEFRKLYTDNYRNAWSAESAQAVRTQLVGGFWDETITKGTTLVQQNRADGRRNAHGVNLYEYQ